MDDTIINPDDLAQLARLALIGKPKDVQLYVRKLINRYRLSLPNLADQLGGILRDSSKSSSPLRGAIVDSIPVDLDSRLQLARTEYPVLLDADPVWSCALRDQLVQIISERQREAELIQAGLNPTKSAIFTGPPGVGKTLAARWIAHELNRPLIVLDLSAVMSSFLGRTGNNVRNVLDYAKGVDCVFLLDEFDAIAKRRDDAVEIGELKRLVTVLLQEIDDWPSSGLLLAATNHPELLDPAVWRRFEMIVRFPMPNAEQMIAAIEQQIGRDREAKQWSVVLASALAGLSFADADRELMRAKRQAVMQNQPLVANLQRIVHERAKDIPRDQRAQLAVGLMKLGLSQREAHEWTGVSRDTIRKATNR
jgi:SpoVK/Ycf46/Vps4 family AAA+-type ATPase